ncbi:MAG: cysteine dioxygenase family protein [Cyanobacteria bacterium P01_A01_bin.3]
MTPSLHSKLAATSLDLPPSIQTLIASIRSQSNITPDLARQLIVDANITEHELAPWANFQHPVAHSYGRKLIYAEPHFEILVMSWAEGDYSAIHDHGVAQWGAVQCFGLAEHNVYQLNNRTLRLVEQGLSYPNSVNAVDSDLIHQMGNPSRVEFLSLHVYGCAAGHPSVTSDAGVFDLFEGCIHHTDGGVFFCLPESDISYRIEGLRGDRDTTLMHHQWMLARVQRMLGSDEECDRRWLREREVQLLDRIERLRSTSPAATF